jgi:hypothetical protein
MEWRRPCPTRRRRRAPTRRCELDDPRRFAIEGVLDRGVLAQYTGERFGKLRDIIREDGRGEPRPREADVEALVTDQVSIGAIDVENDAIDGTTLGTVDGSDVSVIPMGFDSEVEDLVSTLVVNRGATGGSIDGEHDGLGAIGSVASRLVAGEANAVPNLKCPRL